MNDFQSVESGRGLLKDFYDDGDATESAVRDALREKRRKLSEKILVPTKEDMENGNEPQ